MLYYTKVPDDLAMDPLDTADATTCGLLAAYCAPALAIAPEFRTATAWADCSRVTLFSSCGEDRIG